MALAKSKNCKPHRHKGSEIMTILTTIALSGCLLVLALGGACLLAERGYSFDLRKKFRRISIGGGRRNSDPAVKVN